MEIRVDQFYQMLKLHKILVELDKPHFLKTHQKYLRLSVQNIVKTTKLPAKFVSDTLIEWEESIIIPTLLKKQLSIEVYENHIFGYNPEKQITSVLKGNIIVNDPEENNGSWEIFSQKGEKVGSISANVTVKKPRPRDEAANLATFPNENKVLRIKSIVAHVPTMKNKRGYIKVQIGDRIAETATVKSRSGEMVFIEKMQLEKQYRQKAAKITVYSLGIERKEVGQGVFVLLGGTPKKKVIIESDGIEIGEMYIDAKILTKQDIRESRVSKYDYIESSFASEKHNSPDFQLLTSPRRNRKTNLDFSRLSLVDRKKQVSVMGKNNDIVFGKQKRFAIYQDKQNDRVTYLADRSFQFGYPSTKKHYRGASMGLGRKTDFTKQIKENPGVGNYQLPSIWDRY